jgi:hypothetical protein
MYLTCCGDYGVFQVLHETLEDIAFEPISVKYIPAIKRNAHDVCCRSVFKISFVVMRVGDLISD